MEKVTSLFIFFLGLLVVVNCGESSKDELKIDVISKPEICDVKSKSGDMLTMHYTGTLSDGTKFDSRYVKLKPFILSCLKKIIEKSN